MKSKWIGSRIGSSSAATPRLSAASAARRSERRSPWVTGTSTGVAPVSTARSSEFSVRLKRNVAPACAPRRSSPVSAESTLTTNPAPTSPRTASSRCGNGVSGRQPRSITSAPPARIVAARLRIASTVSAEASTISAKIRMSWRERSTARLPLPKYAGRSLSSSGPRSNGTPNSPARRSRSARQRPGTRTRFAVSGRGKRREMMFSVISAATLYADIEDRRLKRSLIQPGNELFQARIRKVAGQKKNALRLSHRVRARACAAPGRARVRRACRQRAFPRTTAAARYSRDRCDVEKP